tara:strand:+ start:33977 stop:34147 length:171 start_codon:yes stop_codon:yes gene_type:complete
MLENLLTAYEIVTGVTTIALIGWTIYKTIKKKREEKLMYFDKDDQRFINQNKWGEE